MYRVSIYSNYTLEIRDRYSKNNGPSRWFSLPSGHIPFMQYRRFMVLVEPFHINLDNSKWPYIYIKFDPPKNGWNLMIPVVSLLFFHLHFNWMYHNLQVTWSLRVLDHSGMVRFPLLVSHHWSDSRLLGDTFRGVQTVANRRPKKIRASYVIGIGV